MVLDQQVQKYNAAHKDEAPIRYNARVAKINYLILVCLIVLFGHVLPELFGFPREIAILSLLPMVLISWFSYEVFTTNLALKERIRAREKAAEDEHLARTTRDFAERGKLEAEADLLREKRLLEEAVAKQKQAEARIAREERLATEHQTSHQVSHQVHQVSHQVSHQVEYRQPSNGAAKPWDERSFAEIEAALVMGEEPPPIKHLATWGRYLRLRELIETDQQFDIKAAELVGVNAVRFRKDLKLLAAHRMVKEVSRGVYVLVEPINI